MQVRVVMFRDVGWPVNCEMEFFEALELMHEGGAVVWDRDGCELRMGNIGRITIGVWDLVEQTGYGCVVDDIGTARWVLKKDPLRWERE